MRNFVYLDFDKLRSMSSQLFEGVTEYVLNRHASESEGHEEQKGPVRSGRTLADILRKTTSTSELRFLEDHAYALFEAELLERKLLTIIDRAALTPIDSAFVLVKSKMSLNDTSKVTRLLAEFNTIGEAIYRVGNHDSLLKKGLGKMPSDPEIRIRAKAEGMQLDQKFLDAIATVLNFGYQDFLEAQFELEGVLYSAPLKRDSLREREEMLVQKYARSSSVSFNVLGIITQQGVRAGPIASEVTNQAASLKSAMKGVINSMMEIEENFTGQVANEVVLDPIAIYFPL